MVARPLYIPKGMYTSSIQWFPFLHTLTNTCYCLSFVVFSFWLCWAFVAVRALSRCGESQPFLLAVHALLTAVASLIAEHRL